MRLHCFNKIFEFGWSYRSFFPTFNSNQLQISINSQWVTSVTVFICQKFDIWKNDCLLVKYHWQFRRSIDLLLSVQCHISNWFLCLWIGTVKCACVVCHHVPLLNESYLELGSTNDYLVIPTKWSALSIYMNWSNYTSLVLFKKVRSNCCKVPRLGLSSYSLSTWFFGGLSFHPQPSSRIELKLVFDTFAGGFLLLY